MPEIVNPEIHEQTENSNPVLLSHEVREIISYKPVWIVRNGIMLFLIIICLLISVTFFISYPDIVNASATVVPVNAPKPIIAKTGGRLIKLFKTDGVNCNKIEEIPVLFTKSHNSFIHLGELQTDYRSFAESFLNFTNYLSSGFYVKKKRMLQKDFFNTKKLFSNLLTQKELNEKDLALTQKTHDAQQSLNKDKVISDYDMRNEESRLIGKTMTIPQIDAALINNENQQNALAKEMLELDNQIVQQKKIFVQALNNFKANVEGWKAKYVLTAPIDGLVSYTGFLQVNQQIPEGKTIGFIVPDNTQYFCEMNLSQTNFGKVKTGQEVMLKFQSYPYPEFGSVKGKIELIKNIPTDSGYLSKVFLPKGLLTNYNKQLLFTNGMKAQAEIITADLKLSDRLFTQFKSLIKNN